MILAGACLPEFAKYGMDIRGVIHLTQFASAGIDVRGIALDEKSGWGLRGSWYRHHWDSTQWSNECQPKQVHRSAGLWKQWRSSGDHGSVTYVLIHGPGLCISWLKVIGRKLKLPRLIGMEVV